ncbi:MAG: DNA sulfur modification protein DndD [Acidobacteria bacterium]|nr:DNA sulfur modification protein DndD [Acidobacteriota bacterium]
MLIEELELYNFGVYKGRHVVNLHSIRKEAPIILIGGLNGDGKTTFLDALQLALYGRRARFAKRGNVSYDTYLKNSITRGVPQAAGASVCIQFRLRVSGQDQTFRISRSWSYQKHRIVENVKVEVDGRDDRVSAERWNEIIDEYMPVGISQLFFFDGEKIEALADEGKARELLSKAIKSLLGLDLVSQLSTDLAVFESRQRMVHKSRDEKAELENLRHQINEIEKTRASYVDAQAHLQTNEVDKYERRLDNLSRDYLRKGGQLAEEREKVESDRARANR